MYPKYLECSFQVTKSTSRIPLNNRASSLKVYILSQFNKYCLIPELSLPFVIIEATVCLLYFCLCDSRTWYRKPYLMDCNYGHWIYSTAIYSGFLATSWITNFGSIRSFLTYHRALKCWLYLENTLCTILWTILISLDQWHLTWKKCVFFLANRFTDCTYQLQNSWFKSYTIPIFTVFDISSFLLIDCICLLT
jgi:hypothetical protein